MKFFTKVPALLFASLLVASCGSGSNKSGSSNNVVDGVTDFSQGVPTSEGTSHSTITEIRDSFDSSNFGGGLVAGDLLVREVNSTSNSGLSFGFSYSFSFGNSTNNNFGNEFSINEIVSAGSDSVSAKKVSNYDQYSGNHQYGLSRTISKSAIEYDAMLLRNITACNDSNTQIIPVSISVETIMANQQTERRTIKGTRIYCEATTSSFGGFFVTTKVLVNAVYTNALPAAANPIVLEGDSVQLGRLLSVGNTYIRGIQ